jgi:hypothetical protein
MKELFVPYEESLALRELGFNQPTNYLYNSSHDTPEAFPCDRPGIWKDWNSMYKQHESTKHLLSAPLYQQAFEWFREKHGLFGYVSPGVLKSKLLFFPVLHNKEDILWEDIDCNIESHKEAQSIVLKKMIEMVKNRLI